MSANYKESTVAGTTWMRCAAITIQNEYQRAPYIQFDEQRVINVGDIGVIQPHGTLRMDFTPAAVIEMIDPATGLPTGETVTQEHAYAVLYSAYIQTALARDAAAALE